MMALLFIITVLSFTGTMVDSASNITSNITGCDAPLSNTTCTQGSCQQPPCTMQCGLSTPYDNCEQRCDSSRCDSMKCDAEDRCLQQCSDGNCTAMTCDAKNCFQTCNRGICGVMTCAKNARNTIFCEQTSVTAKMICESETCTQNCNAGNCTLTCSSSVKRCTQNCDGGNCQYKCEADACTLKCEGGTCTEIESSTTPTSSGDRLHMKAFVGWVLMLAVAAFM